MKTYSVALLSNDGHWITNWNKYNNLEDINWIKVESFCIEKGYLAYGFYYGHNSNVLTSSRCRSRLKSIQKGELK